MCLRDTGNADEWVGTPSTLLKTLNTIAKAINVDTELKTWPKSARWLVGRLDEIKSELKEVGISYSERKERTGKGVAPKRIIRLAFS